MSTSWQESEAGPPPPGQFAADYSQVNGLAIASVLLAVLVISANLI